MNKYTTLSVYAVNLSFVKLSGVVKAVTKIVTECPWMKSCHIKYETWSVIFLCGLYTSMFMLYLLRPPTKQCYCDATMHALYFLSKESLSTRVSYLLLKKKVREGEMKQLPKDENGSKCFTSLPWQKIKYMHRDVKLASFARGLS